MSTACIDVNWSFTTNHTCSGHRTGTSLPLAATTTVWQCGIGGRTRSQRPLCSTRRPSRHWPGHHTGVACWPQALAWLTATSGSATRLQSTDGSYSWLRITCWNHPMCISACIKPWPRCRRLWNTVSGKSTAAFDTGSQVCNLVFSPAVEELASSHGCCFLSNWHGYTPSHTCLCLLQHGV